MDEPLPRTLEWDAEIGVALVGIKNNLRLWKEKKILVLKSVSPMEMPMNTVIRF